MKEKNNNLWTYLINLCFFLYFLILIVERAISVILSLTNGINIYGTRFDGYVYTMVFLSIAGFIVYLLITCRDNIKALFVKDEKIEFGHLCIASGIILLSGMHHTEYTVAPIQFVSYGFLIIAFILKVVSSENKTPLMWISLVYLISFSMAIPVMYRSDIELYVLFHFFEGIAVLVLVALFTYLLLILFSDEDDLFNILPIVIAILLDGSLIVMRWEEEINYFVLIFISLSALIYIGAVIFRGISKKKEKIKQTE